MLTYRTVRTNTAFSSIEMGHSWKLTVSEEMPQIVLKKNN